MSKKDKKNSDFRYDTGEARIPWAAVGEVIREDDIMALIKFLVAADKGKQKKYTSQLKRVSKEIAKLGEYGQPATKLSLGKNVSKLEAKTCKMLNADHALFLTNATAGFEIAYKFAGLKPGDEVIAPAITFIATIAYPLSIGAKVVLADVDPMTINMDPADVAKKITPKTKAIIPVHIGGRPVDMDPIMELAKKHDLTVIEDAAHAFGAEYKGKMIGTVGDFGAFSFHEVKNINSLGEGGLLVSNSSFGPDLSKSRFLGLDLSHKIKNWLYDVVALEGKDGFFAAGNHSSTEIQALCLMEQMKRLKKIIKKRRDAAKYLHERFRNIDGIIPAAEDTADSKSTHHLFLLQIDPEITGGDIQILKKKLEDKGIINIQHFAPLYKFSIMQQLGYDTDALAKSCPVAEEMFNRRFTHLPLYDFSKKDITYIADTVIDCINEMKSAQ